MVSGGGTSGAAGTLERFRDIEERLATGRLVDISDVARETGLQVQTLGEPGFLSGYIDPWGRPALRRLIDWLSGQLFNDPEDFRGRDFSTRRRFQSGKLGAVELVYSVSARRVVMVLGSE